jgi:hypothetical protein
VVFAPLRHRGGVGDGNVEAIALHLGMSFAAVVAQVSSIFCFASNEIEISGFGS